VGGGEPSPVGVGEVKYCHAGGSGAAGGAGGVGEGGGGAGAGVGSAGLAGSAGGAPSAGGVGSTQPGVSPMRSPVIATLGLTATVSQLSCHGLAT
jgi:hypothetical protein